MKKSDFHAGLQKLASPVLPLVRLVQLLYLTGPFEKVSDVLSELNEPVDMAVRYESPQAMLAPYLKIMEEFHRLKTHQKCEYKILNESEEELGLFEAIDTWVAHQVLMKELEEINSQLCAPSNCILCCVGPDESQEQLFFEIPLLEGEKDLFPVNHFDDDGLRKLSPYSDPSPAVNGKRFYEKEASIYRWQSGWSLILPRLSHCPRLISKKCSIYLERPDVCRRPQVFSYVVERSQQYDEKNNGQVVKAYVERKKILAVWDCPYVKKFKNEIAQYAELCELGPVFKENKV